MSDHPPGGTSSIARAPGQPLSDEDVIVGSVTDPGQFAMLFDRHAPAVHRYLSRRVGDLADDLLSETFLIAFRRRSAYRAVHVEVRPWLLGIATHLVHGQQRTEQRRLRALSRTAPLAPALPADDDDLSDRLTARALRGPIAAALAGLKAADRDVLLLFAWEQLTYEEIAAVLDVPIGTVRSRLHRARRQTRTALADALPAEETR
ncbi:RNA polymerase sigma factor [Modestobacter sp. VKM Ac-2984]|uniref:RNA polymerase sigma factor n=1 Tax=Modestobacter sp. VKM Ac-2984 TaxID=3004138 RepID=UPI0022AB2569|nr:RNA polymerase sigma factor [Modestobacter sp. VKM Ac-2984]MCZ2815340.1 RNA polymerase sigma factor [Modestobacter sp. VKM Ac-2984]